MDNTNLPTTQNNFNSQNPLSVLKNLNAFIKIKEFDKVGHLVMPICNKHAVLSGIDKEIDPFTKEEIAKYTAIHLKNLTFEEIEIAFQNERFNLYDKKAIHYNFFSIDYFVEIITKYKAWKQSQMTIHNIPMNQILLPDNSESTAEKNKKAIRIEFIIHIFNQLNETKKEYINDAFTLYEDFVQHKLIDVTDQQKKDLYAVIVKETIKETNHQISTAFKKHIKKELQSYVQKIKNKSKDNQVANKCMAYLVCKSMRSHQSAEEILKKLNLEN
jgi:ribosomal protein L17